MKTRVIYLKGDVSDEARLHEAESQGFKLQSVVVIQGQAVGYLVREPWLDPQPILVQGPPIELKQPLPPGKVEVHEPNKHNKKK